MITDPQILALIDELESLRSQRDDHWQVPRVEGELLFHIAVACGARTIVEAGTSYGFSGLFWAAALRRNGGGTLHTIDLDPRKVESARQTFARAAVGDLIVQHHGDANALLASMPGPIDLAFIDAGDKRQATQMFAAVWPLVRPGGSVITDNATTHKAELAPFVQHVRGRRDASSVEVAVGNGIEWTVKLRA